MTPRWQALAAQGAKAQRPLWASTGTKDPKLPDTMYIDALIAPDTVNTIPPETFNAFRDHGKPEVRITPASELEATAQLAAYEKLGLAPLAERTAFLEADGVKKFSESWNALLKTVQAQDGLVLRRSRDLNADKRVRSTCLSVRVLASVQGSSPPSSRRSVAHHLDHRRDDRGCPDRLRLRS